MDADDWKIALGLRAKALRMDQGLTLKTLAAHSGLSVRFLSQVEAGQANPSLGSLRDLARGLGCPLAALLFALPSPAHRQLIEKIAEIPERTVVAVLGGLAPPTRRPIALLGLRGAGKSTVGAALAKALNRPFIEVDKRIEEEAGLSLGALFEMHGEARYRALERDVLVETLQDTRAIVATGGGVVTHPENAAFLQTHAMTVWLRANPQTHWDRVRDQGDERPMANRARARAELETLYASRAPLYAAANYIVDTENKSVDAVVQELVRQLMPTRAR